MEEFKDLKTCFEELTYMNCQYEIFKRNKKNKNSQAKQFNNYYMQCLKKHNQLQQVNSDGSESDPMRIDSPSANKFESNKRFERSLSSRKSSEMNSIIYDESDKCSTKDMNSFSNKVIILIYFYEIHFFFHFFSYVNF